MTRTYNAGNKVEGGFYFNLDDWTMTVAPREGLELPGEPGARYARLPMPVLLVAAPVLSLAFVVFLPFIGLVLFTKAGVDKGFEVAHALRHAPTGDTVEARKKA
jgi:hypothetical protein